MPEFGELPPAPEKKIPSWVPSELHDAWKDADISDMYGESSTPESRYSIIHALNRIRKVKDWPTLAQLHSKEGHVPKEMVNEVFDLDGRKHSYSEDWRKGVLSHPKSDIDEDQLHKIINNKDLRSEVRARAWVHPKTPQDTPLPRELVPAHFRDYDTQKILKTTPDARIATIIRNSYPDKESSHYDTGSFINSLNNEQGQEIGLKDKPQTLQAILEHPSSSVAAKVAKQYPIPDNVLHNVLNNTAPSIDGRQLTDDERKMLAVSEYPHSNDPAVNDGYQKNEEFQDRFYKENKDKDQLLERLSSNKNLTTPQIDKLAHHIQSLDTPGVNNHYDVNSHISRIAGLPATNAETQKRLFKNPRVLGDILSRDLDKQDADPNHVSMVKPEVLNEIFPEVFHKLNSTEGLDTKPESVRNEEYNTLRNILDHKDLSPQNIQVAHDALRDDLDQKGWSRIAPERLLHHNNISPELKRQMWDESKRLSPKEVEHLNRGLVNPSKPEEIDNVVLGKMRGAGRALLSDKDLDPNLTSDILDKTSLLPRESGDFPAIKDHHLRQIFEKAKMGKYEQLGGLREDGDNAAATKIATRLTKDPQLIRDIHAHQKAVWDAADAPSVYKAGSGKQTREQQRHIDPYVKNPNTPSDVITKLHEDYPEESLMEHQNFPQERLEQIANMKDEELPKKQGRYSDERGNKKEHLDTSQRDKAQHMLGENDPDKYGYRTGGPGQNLKTPQEDLDLLNELGVKPTGQDPRRGIDFGHIESKPGMAKLRVFRDKILENNPSKGELSPKDLGQGPFAGNWKPVQEKNGNISAKKIQELIDTQPSQHHNFSHEEWRGAQRHSEHPQRVFKLNVGTDHIKQMKQAGVYDAFKKLSSYSEESGHPSDANHTIGWIRYEHHTKKPELPGKDLKSIDNPVEGESHKPGWSEAEGQPDTVHQKPEAIHVDEIQTDMGPNTLSKLRENPSRARSLGVDPDHLEKVNNILFGKHHPSELLMEAFRQHHRDQGRSDVPIHVLDAKTKAPISGQTADDPKRPLPAHMQFTYNQMPKKMGFQPDKYGATQEQDNPEIKPTPGSIWTDKIRKFEEELINKALTDIKPGFPTHEYAEAKQKKLPENIGLGRRNWFDYGHLLSPQQKRSGYQLFVNHVPDSKIKASVFHKGDWKGDVEAKINPYSGDKMRIDTAHVSDKHRGKGLGSAMYEAVLAHGLHSGINTVHGGSHSSMAHAVHHKVAQKHGLAYSALPNYLEGSYQHWPDKETFDEVPSGPYDEKYGKYEYMIKKEKEDPERHPFRAAGFKHNKTGQIVETGHHHDISLLPGGEDTHEEYTDGFIDHAGVFHDRHQAAKIAELSVKIHHRKWLDSFDKEAGFSKNADGIVSMLEQDDPMDKILALKSTMVQPHHILLAINDVDPQVRAFAATHPGINGPLLMECLRQCKSPDAFQLLLGHEACDDSHLNYALETDWGGNGGPSDDEELA